jgi:aldehyde dehydrogenase (NAD+)
VVASLAEGLTVGDPLDKATDIGPLVSSPQRERVLNYIEIGKSERAKLVAAARCGRPTSNAPPR